MMDSYVYIITALLPLAALMLVVQVNPYQALVIRGILGAIAALVYTVLGAADVALTEALVGTLLAITLYAVAVRSSLVLRLGVLKDAIETENVTSSQFRQLMTEINTIFSKHHLRVELIPYLDSVDLCQALLDKEVHVICDRSDSEHEFQNWSQNESDIEMKHQAIAVDQLHPYCTTTRLRRLHEILQAELMSSAVHLTDVHSTDVHLTDTNPADSNL